MTEDKFLQKVQHWIFKNYRTQREAAAALGHSPAYLNKILKGKKPISKKILDAMGYTKKVVKVTTYPKIEA